MVGREGNLVKSRQRREQSEILSLLAPRLRGIFEGVDVDFWFDLEEIRLRAGRPLQIEKGSSFFLTDQGNLSNDPGKAYCVDEEDINRTLQLIGGNSLYTLEEELRAGFITVPGGHRIGLVGECLSAGGRLVRIKRVTGLNIRLSRQLVGISRRLVPFLIEQGRPLRTLILSPPQAGKTTLLRDIIRTFGRGEGLISPVKVGVVDERNEISGSYRGIPQLDLGFCTDVLCGCPKRDGVFLLLRSMGPQVIATDEIGRSEDIAFIEEILNSGVGFISTAHAWHTQDLSVRPGLRRIWSRGQLERVIILSRRFGSGTLEGVWDGQTKEPLFLGPVHLEVDDLEVGT